MLWTAMGAEIARFGWISGLEVARFRDPSSCARCRSWRVRFNRDDGPPKSRILIPVSSDSPSVTKSRPSVVSSPHSVGQDGENDVVWAAAGSGGHFAAGGRLAGRYVLHSGRAECVVRASGPSWMRTDSRVQQHWSTTSCISWGETTASCRSAAVKLSRHVGAPGFDVNDSDC